MVADLRQFYPHLTESVPEGGSPRHIEVRAAQLSWGSRCQAHQHLSRPVCSVGSGRWLKSWSGMIRSLGARLAERDGVAELAPHLREGKEDRD